MAVCAHISLPLPFTPVPLTLQTFAVILVGMVLGPVAGFSAMVLYLAEGAMGMPVFSPHGIGGMAQLLGPTGGYLFAYPLAAAAAGWIVRAMRNVGSRFTCAVVAGIVADVIIFALAACWLARLLHLGIPAAWTLAIAPFLLGRGHQDHRRRWHLQRHAALAAFVTKAAIRAHIFSLRRAVWLGRASHLFQFSQGLLQS